LTSGDIIYDITIYLSEFGKKQLENAMGNEKRIKELYEKLTETLLA